MDDEQRKMLEDSHVAWMRYRHHAGRPATIHVCDSDAPGAFKVFHEEVVSALLAPPRVITDASVEVGEDWTPCVKLPVVVHARKQRAGESHISTREGITPVKDDDLIMRGVQGEEYPIGRELFERTYRIVKDVTLPQWPEAK